MTSVLPKTARTVISLTIELAASKNTIDATTALALTALLSDKQFAIEFKTKMLDTQVQEKSQRAINKEARLQKQAETQGISIDELKSRIIESKEASNKTTASGSSSPSQSPDSK
jgi:hypothetical protein